jgi:hypothetical protein
MQLLIDKKHVDLKLSFAVNGAGQSAGGFSPEGFQLDLLASSAPAQGSIWVKGWAAPVRVHGRAALTHGWSEHSPLEMIPRFVRFFSLGSGKALHWTEIETRIGTIHRWLTLSDDDAVEFSTDQFEILYAGRPAEANRSAARDYWVPATVRFSGPQVAGRAELARHVLTHDPLRQFFGPLRFLVRLFIQPFGYCASAPFDAYIRPNVDGPAEHLSGEGLVCVEYLRATPPPKRAVSTRPGPHDDG